MKEINNTRDTLNFWITNQDKDTLKIQVKDNNKVVDTIKINLGQKTKSKRAAKKERLQFKVSASNNGSYDFFKPLTILFSNPVGVSDFKKISLIEGKDTVKPKYSFPDSNKRKLLINYQLKESTDYKLFIKPQAFKDIYNIPSDTIKANFKTKSAKSYGTLTVIADFTGNSLPKIIQLLDEKDNLLKETKLTEKGKFTFTYMPPGKYKLRMIYDANNNGKWDTGNYLKHVQPEKISYYPKEIISRDNWDTQIEWKN